MSSKPKADANERRTDTDLVFQVNSHLVYELKWLIHAAACFEHGDRLFQSADEPIAVRPYMAFLDSAALHGRNLLEWASSNKIAPHFTLKALGGTPVQTEGWGRWANNRVMHMLLREHDKAPWPEGREAWNKPDRFMRMAGAILDYLSEGLLTVPEGEARDAFETVLSAAQDYWKDPTEMNHQALHALYDSSKDEEYPE